MSERDEPVFARDEAPDHGLNFWGDLETSLSEETSVMGAAVPTLVASPDRSNQTAQLAPVVRPVRPSRRLWPLAAAAAVLAVVGLGLVGWQRSDTPVTTTETVAGTTETTQVVPLDGPEGSESSDADSAGAAEIDDQGTAAGIVATPVPEREVAVAPVPTPTSVPPREFDGAIGAAGTAAYLPFDDSLGSDATFLANWDAQALTWYAETDDTSNCADSGVAEISYVNGSGLVQDLRDPQLRFSGEIAHFTIHPDENLAAWMVACGTQLELYAATLASSGQVEHLNLVWLGVGSSQAARVSWDNTEVNMNSIDPNGMPFVIGYDVETDVLKRNGGPSRDSLETDSPSRRDATPAAATADGGVSYWIGQAPADVFSACPETYGSEQTDTLWLRHDEGTWQPALAENTPLGRITAVAIEPAFTQIAFADVCDGQTQRLFLGTQLADGKISNLREISLTPFVPGFASELFWIDAQTLRIEIDNSEFGALPNRLDLRLDDDRQTGIIVQLD